MQLWQLKIIRRQKKSRVLKLFSRNVRPTTRSSSHGRKKTPFAQTRRRTESTTPGYETRATAQQEMLRVQEGGTRLLEERRAKMAELQARKRLLWKHDFDRAAEIKKQEEVLSATPLDTASARTTSQ